MKIWAAIGCAMLLAPAAFAQQTPDKKPNIAVTGCLMSQGYATFMVEKAHIDGSGDKAAASVSATIARPGSLAEPTKWILDAPGNIRMHVGEIVQVLGTTEWKPGDPFPQEPAGLGPGAPTPHITVIAVKPVSPSCS